MKKHIRVTALLVVLLVGSVSACNKVSSASSGGDSNPDTHGQSQGKAHSARLLTVHLI